MSDTLTSSPAGAADRAGLPLTFGQEQLWFIDEFHHGLPAHNLARLVWLRGTLDEPALRRALDAVVARHEALRTRLIAGADGRPAQVIDPPAPVPLEEAEYVAADSETDPEAGPEAGPAAAAS